MRHRKNPFSCKKNRLRKKNDFMGRGFGKGEAKLLNLRLVRIVGCKSVNEKLKKVRNHIYTMKKITLFPEIKGNAIYVFWKEENRVVAACYPSGLVTYSSERDRATFQRFLEGRIKRTPNGGYIGSERDLRRAGIIWPELCTGPF
jgi:hypothetical protein